jgi:hypothetical protein
VRWACRCVASIMLDRVLFPLLVGIEQFGLIGVVELADRVGRDYMTVRLRSWKASASSSVEPLEQTRRLSGSTAHTTRIRGGLGEGESLHSGRNTIASKPCSLTPYWPERS